MAKKRGRETARDMIFSMGAVLLTVLIIMGITYRSHGQKMPVANFDQAQSTALSQGSWPILVPGRGSGGTLAGYQLTQARFEAESYGKPGASRWYLGYKTAAGEYVSLWQSDGDQKQIIAAASNNGVCSGQMKIAGKTWSMCSQKKPLARLLYRPLGADTAYVSGTASFAELAKFVALLVPVTKGS
jgi:Protein of unknown function (DUF4245)